MTESSSLGERAGRAAVWNVLGLGALSILSFATTILLARTLSDAEIATYGLFVASVAGLLACVDLGLSSSIPKFAAEVGPRGMPGLLRAVLATKLLLLGAAATLLYTVAGAARSWIGLPSEAPAEFVAAVLIVASLDALADVLQQGLTTRLAQGSVQVVRVTESLVLSGGTIGLVLAGFGVTGVLAAFVASSFVKATLSAVLLARVMRRAAPTEAGDAAVTFRRFARHSAAMYATKMCAWLAGPAYLTVVLGGAVGPSAVAPFTVAADLVGRLYELASAPLNSILYALFANLALRGDPEPTRRAYASLLRFYAMALVPMAAGLGVLAPDLMPALYGARFRTAVPYFQVFLVGVFLDHLFYAVGSSALLTAERYRVVLLSRVPVLAAAVVAGWVAREHGALAVVAAVGAGRLAASWVLALFAHATLDMRTPVRFLARLAAIAAVLAVPLHFAERALPPSVAACAGLAFAYGATWWALFKLTGGIGADERARLAGMRLPMKAWVLRAL